MTIYSPRLFIFISISTLLVLENLLRFSTQTNRPINELRKYFFPRQTLFASLPLTDTPTCPGVRVGLSVAFPQTSIRFFYLHPPLPLFLLSLFFVPILFSLKQFLF